MPRRKEWARLKSIISVNTTPPTIITIGALNTSDMVPLVRLAKAMVPPHVHRVDRRNAVSNFVGNNGLDDSVGNRHKPRFAGAHGCGCYQGNPGSRGQPYNDGSQPASYTQNKEDPTARDLSRTPASKTAEVSAPAPTADIR
jgi:hypothetical protein